MAATMIATSVGVALATGGADLFDGDTRAGLSPTEAPVVYQELTAQIRTDWLAPVGARRSFDQRKQALERWVTARHGWVQVIDTESLMRTRGDFGERLATPAARFEQTLLIHVPAEHAPETIAQALAGLDVTVASIEAIGPTESGVSTRVEF
jgi:hypothetical protein